PRQRLPVSREAVTRRERRSVADGVVHGEDGRGRQSAGREGRDAAAIQRHREGEGKQEEQVERADEDRDSETEPGRGREAPVAPGLEGGQERGEAPEGGDDVTHGLNGLEDEDRRGSQNRRGRRGGPRSQPETPSQEIHDDESKESGGGAHEIGSRAPA